MIPNTARKAACFVCFVIWFFVGRAVSASEEFKVIGDGYRANLEAFPKYTCKFRVDGGEGASLSDIFQDKTVTGGGTVLFATWIVNGKKERFYVTPEEGAALGKPVGPNARTITYNYASDGDLILDVGLRFPAAVLKKAVGNEFINSLGTPVSCGVRNDLGVLRLRHARQELKVDFLGVHQVFGIGALRFKIWEGKDRLCQVLTVDPRRGCLPVRSDHFIPPGRSRDADAIAMITHLKEFPGKRWFPMRAVLVINNPPSGPYIFREFKVTHFDPDTPIADDGFSMTIPAGYQVQLEGDKFALLGTTKETRVRLGDLPRLLDDLKKSGKHHQAVAATYRERAETPGAGSRHLTVISAVLAVSIMLVLFYVGVRRMRSKNLPQAQ